MHISGKDNVLADTLSRLIDTDPDLKQQPELEGHEFSKYCFETLPKVRGSAHHKRIGGDEFDVCEIQITYENPKNSELLVKLPLEDEKFVSLQEQDPKIMAPNFKMIYFPGLQNSLESKEKFIHLHIDLSLMDSSRDSINFSKVAYS